MARYDSRRIRSGDEPMHARTPLRMRLVLALIGLASAVAGVVFFAYEKAPGWTVGCGVIAVVMLTDVGVIIRHIRQGPHYQPGRDIPPYRPVEEHAEAITPKPPFTLRSRRTVYLAMMTVCMALIINAWTWVRHFSTTAAVAMSAVAAVIPPFAAMIANARGGGRDWTWEDDDQRGGF